MSGLWISGRVVLTTGNRADAPSPDRMVTDHHDLEDIMFRTTLTTSRTRRYSGAVVAATAAAMVLTPGVAFAAGQPAGPGPGSGHSGTTAGSHRSGHPGHATGHSGHSAGHSAGRSGTGHSGSGSRSPGHTGAGHSASHATGHAGGSRSGGHAAGHTGSGSSTTSGRTAAHGAKVASHSTGSGSSDGRQDSGSKTSSASSAAGMSETVTRLSVSNSDGIVTMSARVSPAHRGSGASAATGSVTFTVDDASSGPIPMSAGKAMVQVELGPGRHTASAKYSGDAEHAPSDSGAVSVTAG
ncbi:hypothetical protein ABH920_007145 [Catenulispora sp. EB89]|uniref:Ig-like domain-containing protein n=1 Tax=Catenulispora sp. EB89 TaxID=3156257 RepID=UPI0035180175